MRRSATRRRVVDGRARRKRGGECASFHSPPRRCGRTQRSARYEEPSSQLLVPNAHLPRHFVRDPARLDEAAQREVETDLAKLLIAEPAVQLVRGHVAHLVIEE